VVATSVCTSATPAFVATDTGSGCGVADCAAATAGPLVRYALLFALGQTINANTGNASDNATPMTYIVSLCNGSTFESVSCFMIPPVLLDYRYQFLCHSTALFENLQ
jgi:hypothetical protein